MGVIKCSQCGRIVPDTLEKCPKCGNPISATAPQVADTTTTTPAEEPTPVVEPSVVTPEEPTKEEVSAPAEPVAMPEPAQPEPVVEVGATPEPTPEVEAKPKHSPIKRLVVLILSALFALALIGGGAFIIIGGSDSKSASEVQGYAPWTDLSAYYNLGAIVEEDDFCHFNSFEISSDRLPLTREPIVEGEYPAVVLGTGVWVRSYPQLKNRTKRCQVQTGDRLLVTRTVGYSSGCHWSYASVLSGRRAGKEGYISNDYIIEQEKFDVLQRYILSGGSNMNVMTSTRYLNAIATVLCKLNVHMRYPNLEVSMLDTAVLGNNTVVTYRVHDLNIAENSTLLVFVQFFGTSNDYIVLGVVPGSGVNYVAQSANGSYDIYFVR